MEVNPLVVAVDERLKEIKEGLRKGNYQVVSFIENIPVDAVVYYQDGQYKENTDVGMSYSSPLFQMGNGSSGVFLINGYNKTLEEIDQMLQKRTYSPLFRLE